MDKSWVIGRGNVDILIEKNEVSRRHAILTFHDGRFFIADNNSRNGTYIQRNNDYIKVIQDTELYSEDILVFSNVRMTFQEILKCCLDNTTINNADQEQETTYDYTNIQALPIGTKLNNYVIKDVLGSGGFGITYLAQDTTLQFDVAIKEYFPKTIVTRKNNDVVPITMNEKVSFENGLNKFLAEAKTIASFKPKHLYIVNIMLYFEANNTAYFVMDYEEGEDLAHYLLKATSKLTEKEIYEIINPIMYALRKVHEKGILHRDIKPGNIFIKNTGNPILIDFGAAKYEAGKKSNSFSPVTDGYSPIEQYQSKTLQGEYTDIYAIGAVLYKLVTGSVPMKSFARNDSVYNRDEPDPLIPALEKENGNYSNELLSAIDKALEIKAVNRPQNVDELMKMIIQKKSSKWYSFG